MSKQLVGVNENGRRVGESHPRAKLSDREVEQMFELHEKYGLGYRALARKWDLFRVDRNGQRVLNWNYVRNVLARGRRNQTPTEYRPVA